MTPQFSLERQSATLTSYSPRRELHGEDPQPAATLHFSCALPSHALAMFEPTLAHHLFKRPDDGADLADAGNEHGAVRFPQITSALAWDKEIIGAELTLHYGIDERSDIVLPGVKVDKFAIKPEHGGMALVTFRCGCHPDERQSGKLAMLIAESCEITLTPPAPIADLAGERPGTDKPLNTVGNADAPPAGKKRPSRREAKAAAEAAFG